MRCTPSRTRYLGEKVLEHDKETLETIKQEQEKTVVDFCIEKIGQKIITSCGDNSKETWSELSKFLIEDYLLLPTLWDYRSSTYNKDAAKKLLELRRTAKGKFEQILGKYNMELYAFDFDLIEEMSINSRNKIKTYIKILVFIFPSKSAC